jgi:hypothetical protein
MKKIFWIILLVFFLAVPQVFGAAAPGSCTQSQTANYTLSGVRQVFVICTGSADDGSVPDIVLNSANTLFVSGYRLEQVDVYPTSGGTAPGASNVFVLMNGMDLLGSSDGSTAYGGLNLVHATLHRTTPPIFYVAGSGLRGYYFPLITSTLTVRTTGQSTVSANWTIVLTFYK